MPGSKIPACTFPYAAEYIVFEKPAWYYAEKGGARDGTKDYLALGTGQLDIPGYLELAQQRQCSVVLETKTVAGLRQSADWLRHHFRHINVGTVREAGPYVYICNGAINYHSDYRL